jgi:hypothetical protein
MMKIASRLFGMSAIGMFTAALTLVLGFGVPSAASADEADAKKLLKAMSDYMVSEKVFSLQFDANLEVMTKDQQKLMLASSGTLAVGRPDKLRATRSLGFGDVEIVFDGKMVTLLAKNSNLYAQLDLPGSIDQMVDELRDKYQKMLPAADLLISNPYAALMEEVTDIKDLGSGVVGGVECDYLAFRAKDTDWQIWIAQGPRPYPCKYVITSKQISGGPQFTIQVREWKTGSDVVPDDFAFKPPANSRKVEFKDLPGVDDLPKHFVK